MKLKFILAALLLIGGGFPLLAQDRDNGAANPSPSDLRATLVTGTSFWKDGVGNGFRKGAREVGAGAGFAAGGRFFGSQRAHHLVLGGVEAGWVFTDVLMEDSFLRGNAAFLGEIFGGHQVDPHDADLGAFDFLLRYDFATGTRWVPFIEGGVGVMVTDIGTPDLSSAFQFNEKVGFGVFYFLKPQWAISLGVRYMHISNASIRDPNLGVNTFPVMIGINYFF